MKAIETEYNGYKFRSRLEARWAVFFDNADISYEYELEGFKLKSGRYLPDFYLPQFKCFVEIKPTEYDEKRTKGLLEELFHDNGKCCCALCVGDPFDNNVDILCNDSNDSSAGGPNWWNAEFVKCDSLQEEHNHTVNLAINTNHHDKDFWSDCWEPLPVYDSRILDITDKLFCEKMVARKSRFEYGETPIIKKGGGKH